MAIRRRFMGPLIGGSKEEVRLAKAFCLATNKHATMSAQSAAEAVEAVVNTLRTAEFRGQHPALKLRSGVPAIRRAARRAGRAAYGGRAPHLRGSSHAQEDTSSRHHGYIPPTAPQRA